MLAENIKKSIAKKMPQIINILSPTESFEVIHDVGLIKDTTYKLFKENPRLRKVIPEFVRKYVISEEVRDYAQS